MSMPRFMAGATAGLVIAFGAGHTSTLQAQGQENTMGVDLQFLGQVGAGNLLEIRLGQAAEKKASNPSVKEFAKQTVVDHTSMQRQWQALAQKNRIPFKTDLHPQQVEQEKRLNSTSGADFDRTYLSLVVQNHQQDVAAFENERQRAAHPVEVQALLDQNLSTLRTHLTLAQQLSGQVGSGTPPVVVTQPGQVTPNVRADSAFISDVDAANTAELSLARMAEARAQDPRVKQFAQNTVTDHDRMQKEWRDLSWRNGVVGSTNSRAHYQDQATRLGSLSGAEFDREYMTVTVQNHQQHVSAFQTRGRAAQSTEVRQLAERSLPSEQQHLSLAQQVESQVRGTPIATPNPQPGQNEDGQNDKDRERQGNMKADAQFINNVGAHHYLQVRLGRLAQEKARDAEVKRFGKRMEEDHGNFERQLSNTASRNGMKFKPGMGSDNRANLERLEKTSGEAFDRSYMTLMIQTHNAYLNYWRKEGRAARSEPVRQLVNAGLPTLEEHMDLAKRIGKRVGVDAENALAGRRVAADR